MRFSPCLARYRNGRPLGIGKMGLKLSDWTVLLCFCIFGIQNSYQFIAEMNEINQNCVRGGGYCINVIPPPPPRRRMNRRRMRTNTRRGQRGGPRGRRPSPRQVGASHTRLPQSAQNTAQSAAYPPQQTAYQNPPMYDSFTPIGQMGGGAAANTGAGQSFMDPFAAMFMLKRKKRQAVDPEVAAERPRIGRKQNMFNFINLHCRKSEFDFGCRSTGGICCMPHL